MAATIGQHLGQTCPSGKSGRLGLHIIPLSGWRAQAGSVGQSATPYSAWCQRPPWGKIAYSCGRTSPSISSKVTSSCVIITVSINRALIQMRDSAFRPSSRETGRSRLRCIACQNDWRARLVRTRSVLVLLPSVDAAAPEWLTCA